MTDQQLLNKLENNNLQAELTRLKEQVQPDFLSKMLDEAQLLAKKDADKASALIFKLSSLLRYQLYESAREKVFLSDEIRFVTDYLDLEKMCDERLEYKIQVENEVRYIQIPPLLFMPIIEYAVRKEVEKRRGNGEAYSNSFSGKGKKGCFLLAYTVVWRLIHGSVCLRLRYLHWISFRNDWSYYIPDIIYWRISMIISRHVPPAKIDAMKDTENIYDWGRILVERRYS